MSEGSETRGLARSVVVAAVAILVGLSAPAAATLSMMHTYRTGIDIGNDPATGCDFSLGTVPDGPLPGFELQVTVVVDADLMPPQVVSAEVETCSGDGGSFGGAQPLPGFVLEIDSGLLGSDSVVGAIPRSLLGDAVVVRLAHHALSGDGSEDALFTRDGTPGGAAITALLPQPAPAPLLSGLGIALAALLLFGIGFTQWQRGGWGAAAVLVFVASGAVIAYAAFGEPVAVDDPADAVPPDSRAEIVASFVMGTDSELGLRLDIEDIVFVPPTDTPTPVPPTDTPTLLPVCGDGEPEGDEQCDLGLGVNGPGSCCSSTCAFLDSGSLCGDGATECSLQDTCDGAGTCQPNHLTDTTPCGGTSAQCVAQDLCDGSGMCSDKGLEPDGTTCNDANPDTVFDQCTSGTCQGEPNACPEFTQDDIRQVIQDCQDRALDITCSFEVSPEICLLDIPFEASAAIRCLLPAVTDVCGGTFQATQFLAFARYGTDGGGSPNQCDSSSDVNFSSNVFAYSDNVSECQDTVGPAFPAVQACWDLMRAESQVAGVCATGGECLESGRTCLVDADCCNGACTGFFCEVSTAECGDGVVNGVIGETCDDGGTTDGDGCSGSCQIETNYVCSGTPSVCDFDECAAGIDTCIVNEVCTNTPGSFTCACNSTIEVCGDGVDNNCNGAVDEGGCQVCPCVGLSASLTGLPVATWDSSFSPNSTCSDTGAGLRAEKAVSTGTSFVSQRLTVGLPGAGLCRVDNGPNSTTAPMSAAEQPVCEASILAICANGCFESGHACTVDDDCCSGACNAGVCEASTAECGDGVVNGLIGETCDDGGTTGGDGCSGSCQIETNYVCSGTPSVCDFDECAAGTDTCIVNEFCTNTPGSFTCACNSTIEVCGDGVDNNCNGAVDESGCQICPCVGLSASSPGFPVATWDSSFTPSSCSDSGTDGLKAERTLVSGASLILQGITVGLPGAGLCRVDSGFITSTSAPMSPAEEPICEASIRAIAAFNAVNCPAP